jgi:hypothetical protein
MRRSDKAGDVSKKIVIRMRNGVGIKKSPLPPEATTDCGENSSLLVCPNVEDGHQEHGDVLTDDIDQQQQAIEKAKEDKKRRDKQLQTDKAKLQIAKANDRLRALAGIKAE